MRNGLPPEEQLRRNQMYAQGFLWCNECKQFKPTESFYPIRSKTQRSNFGHRRYCKACEPRRRGEVETRKQYRRNRSAQLKHKFVELMGGSCQRCGYKEFLSGLGFHHVAPSLKTHEPTCIVMSNREQESLEELDKCCLLCACCHIAYESGDWSAEFVKREGLGWTIGNLLLIDDNRYGARKPGRPRLHF